jgi:hypothetical protein
MGTIISIGLIVDSLFNLAKFYFSLNLLSVEVLFLFFLALNSLMTQFGDKFCFEGEGTRDKFLVFGNWL